VDEKQLSAADQTDDDAWENRRRKRKEGIDLKAEEKSEDISSDVCNVIKNSIL
jgi:hypothetical protein